MGRKSRQKKNKRNKKRSVKPDEILQYGPLKIERHGKHVVFSNNSTTEQQEKILEHFKIVHENLLQKLPEEVVALQNLIKKYDPVEVMSRAAYTLLPLFLKYTCENEFSSGESYYLPALEYVQYLIARTESNKKYDELTEEGWNELWEQAKKTIILTRDLLTSRKTLTTPPSAIDELRYYLDNRRLAIRVNRYQFFSQQFWKSSLAPYEQWIKEIYGVGVDEIIKGLTEIENYQRTGFLQRYRNSIDTADMLMKKLKEKGFSIDPNDSPEQIERTKKALETEEFKVLNEKCQEAGRLALTSAVFDITDITSLPKSILSLLSVKPGESVVPFVNPDHEDLSPLSTSVLHYKPFLEVNGKFFTFYHSGFEDRIAEIIESELYARFPSKVSELAKRRSDEAESLSKDLLVSLIKPDFVFQNVYYPNPDKEGDLTELDIILGVDDILFLVEVKAGGFSEGASRGAPKSMEREFNDLIIKGQHQSERAEKYIKSSSRVEFFDETGKKAICEIKKDMYRKIFRIVTTREELGWVGAKIAVLSVLDPNLSKSFPWHVSIEDLRVVEELFKDSSVRFIHFLEQRLEASSEIVLSQHDEIEHIALYNALNQYHELPFEGVDRVTFDASYMRSIDVYFTEKAAGENPEVPRQPIPQRVDALIKSLEDSKMPGRFEVVSIILGMGEEGRNDVEKALEHISKGVIEEKLRSARVPFSEISCGFTISNVDSERMREESIRSAALMDQSRCNFWFIIQLEPESEIKIKTIKKIKPGEFTEEELLPGKLHLEKTTQAIVQTERIGRNDKCPCASGKKYKYCHGA